VKNIYKQLGINSRQQLKRILNQRKSQENWTVPRFGDATWIP
jgi:hypothetical protein